MPAWLIVLIVVGVLLVLVAIWAASVYNSLVRRRNESTEALRDVDAALEQRYDNIRAQAQAVSGGLKKEIELILGATALRTGRSVRELSIAEKSELDGALTQAQAKLPGAAASFESYPNSGYDDNVELMQRSVNELEERLGAARRHYNSAATEYNTARQSFPTVLIAPVLGFKHHELFELSNGVKRESYDLEGYLD
ncbi:LemA family protein [Kytococcus sedentarius]|uniref:LemA family protein n=1 Tax=Kytococcus sedentarius TaxID=1276 RepID=UPI001950351C|nr:LemA family protein [Kytococcus sedentarius]QRO86636.1 LemA family protein [Kytococcus sedentarius]